MTSQFHLLQLCDTWRLLLLLKNRCGQRPTPAPPRNYEPSCLLNWAEYYCCYYYLIFHGQEIKLEILSVPRTREQHENEFVIGWDDTSTGSVPSGVKVFGFIWVEIHLFGGGACKCNIRLRRISPEPIASSHGRNFNQNLVCNFCCEIVILTTWCDDGSKLGEDAKSALTLYFRQSLLCAKYLFYPITIR